MGQGPLWPAAAFAVAKTCGTIYGARSWFCGADASAFGGRRADSRFIACKRLRRRRQPLAAIMPLSEDVWSKPELFACPEWHRREQSWHELALLNNELKRRYGEIAADWVARAPTGRLREGSSFVSLQSGNNRFNLGFLAIMQVADFDIPSACGIRSSAPYSGE